MLIQLASRDGSIENIELDVEKDFNIEEYSLDQSMCHAGHLLARYGTLSANLRAEVERKKAALEYYDSQFALEIRRTTEEKLTEAKIENKINADPKHKELLESLIDSERNKDIVENLFKAQMKRVDCMISLAYKLRAEINKGGY